MAGFTDLGSHGRFALAANLLAVCIFYKHIRSPRSLCFINVLVDSSGCYGLNCVYLYLQIFFFFFVFLPFLGLLSWHMEVPRLGV